MSREIDITVQTVPGKNTPARRLLIVPELAQFANAEGIVQWTPDLVETLLNWSDFKIPGHGIYRMALVSRTLTTEQLRNEDQNSIADVLNEWNLSQPEDQQIDIHVIYGNKASTFPGAGNGSGNYGRVEFFTRENFDRQRAEYPKSSPQSTFSSVWHEVLERSLNGEHVELREHHFTHDYRSEEWLPKWLTQGNVHVGEPYRHIVTLARTPEGILKPRCFAL